MELIRQILLIAITAIITMVVAKNKQQAEINKMKAEKDVMNQTHIQGVIDMWKGLVETLTKDVKGLTQEVELLRAENKSLKSEMKKLEKLINEKTNQ